MPKMGVATGLAVAETVDFSGAGKINIIEQADSNSYNASAKIDTANGALTGLFVPEHNILFVAMPHRGTQKTEIRAYHID